MTEAKVNFCISDVWISQEADGEVPDEPFSTRRSTLGLASHLKLLRRRYTPSPHLSIKMQRRYFVEVEERVYT
jgi:hypothetical protein